MEIESLMIFSNASIRTALEKLNKSGLATLFVVNKEKLLLGILTDGSIRRSLLSNYTLDSIVADVMKTDYISFNVNTDSTIILNAINETVKIIPLIDDKNYLIDYASINKIRRIAIAAPLLNGNEIAYVTECIKTNWISSQGKYVRLFEDLFSNYHLSYNALAVSNGTVALHLALVALGIGELDEVIVPDFTFAASVNAVIYSGATPILAEIDPITWNLDIKKLDKLITPKTKAIMPVHLYGNPCDMKSIIEFAERYNLFIIEDCAEALGSFYNGKPVGTFGDAATFSFYGNKTITTGEGGMVLFRDSLVSERAAMLRDHGMNKSKRYWHDEVGFNYRLTNIQAAIGVAQFERLEDFVTAKRRIAKSYNQALCNYNYFQLPFENTNCINSYWLYTFLIKKESPFNRTELMSFLNGLGIETRPVFYPLHIMPPYTKFGNSQDLLCSSEISENGISLPSSVNLTEVEVAYVCNSIIKFINKFN
jgi:perosamine synthetase